MQIEGELVHGAGCTLKVNMGMVLCALWLLHIEGGLVHGTRSTVLGAH